MSQPVDLNMQIAALQALNEELEEENERLRVENATLKDKLEEKSPTPKTHEKLTRYDVVYGEQWPAEDLRKWAYELARDELRKDRPWTRERALGDMSIKVDVVDDFMRMEKQIRVGFRFGGGEAVYFMRYERELRGDGLDPDRRYYMVETDVVETLRLLNLPRGLIDTYRKYIVRSVLNLMMEAIK